MGRPLAAVVCLCLAAGLVAPGAAQLLQQTLTAPAQAIGAASGAVGPILNLLTPFTSPLNGLLQQALQPGAPMAEIANAVAPLVRGVVAVLTEAAIPADPPLWPHLEAPKYGFVGDAFNVTSSDGYILTVFNVRSDKCSEYRSVVALAPGLFSNAGSYILTGEKSLVYQLARRCHDVWMVSFRGTLFGRNHVSLTDMDDAFWDFNPFHYGSIDLPETLEFVRKQSGAEQIRLMGVDRTMTALLFMNDVHGERFQQYLAGAYVMVPAGYLAHQSSAGFAVLSILRDALTASSKTALSGEFPFMETSVHNVLGNLCKYSPLTCFYILNLLGGPTEQLDMEYIPTCFQNLLDSMSIDDLNWFNQQNGKVRQMSYFDYGEKLNFERYGQTDPPQVRLNATTVPCSLFAFKNSTVVTTADVEDTFNDLPSSARHYMTELPGYNAASPYDPVDAEGVYGKIIERLEKDLGDNWAETSVVEAPKSKSLILGGAQERKPQQLDLPHETSKKERRLLRKIAALLH